MKILILIIVIGSSLSQELCRNGTCRWGECEQLTNGFSCHCDLSVKGKYCDRRLLPQESKCLQNPCWNGGKCEDNRNSDTGWICNCQSGYSGSICKQSSNNLCKENKCLNGGVCKTYNNMSSNNKYIF
jgi:hypothetical protein